MRWRDCGHQWGILAGSHTTTSTVQAIRWRLIRSPVGQQRQLVLQILISHDIFGLESAGQGSLVAGLVGLNDTTVTTEALRLISVMASDHKGREYLLSSDGAVILDLFKILSTMPGTSTHRKEGARLTQDT